MTETHLLHDILRASAARAASSVALTHGDQQIPYGDLLEKVERFAAGVMALDLARGERVGVFLEKRLEAVVSCFGASAAGGVFVPINPILRPAQVWHIVRDCGLRVLVTSPQRWPVLLEGMGECPELQHVVVTGALNGLSVPDGVSLHSYEHLSRSASRAGHRVIDTDPVAILYTSGSTGKPKGVVLSHRNVLVGGRSVAQYLENSPDDVLLAALPLSFDAGFSQLTTGFHAGARVVLLNHVLPQDVVKAMARERVTGLTAVPPLWIQLTQVAWPESVEEHLRYFANTGGRMPLETLTQLRRLFPRSKPFLMYGLTEAFRATYLPPEEVDRRPDSIGKAIPHSEVLVLRPDGAICDADEPGELVQRGPLVAMGYWNDADRTEERFRPLPATAGVRNAAVMIPEMAVFSGDVVRRDSEGYLYFIGRRDEMIKTSGYRVSPSEVEEEVYSTGLVGECAVVGIPDDGLGQAIVAVVTPSSGADAVDVEALLVECRLRLPAYMVPRHIKVLTGSLPRNPNGKLDRKQIASQQLGNDV